MLLVLNDLDDVQILDVIEKVKGLGLDVQRLPEVMPACLHVTSSLDEDVLSGLRRLDGVTRVTRLTEPVRSHVTERRYYPHLALQFAIALVAVSAALVFLASFFPPPIGSHPDLVKPQPTVAPEWYLWAPRFFSRGVGNGLALGFTALLWFGFLAVPLTDRILKHFVESHHRVAIGSGVTAFALLVVCSILGYAT